MAAHLENEPRLVTEAKAGNAEAFTTLMNQYDRYIYRLALNITGNREDAEDVLQETFLKAYSNLAQFRGDSRFYTWLVRIAVNESLMKLRQRRGYHSVSLDDAAETDNNDLGPLQIADWRETPEEHYTAVELQRILFEAIEGLEPSLRIVAVLRDVEELSTAETARLLQLSVPAVKTRLLRGRLKLRERLNRYFRQPMLAVHLRPKLPPIEAPLQHEERPS